MRDIKVVAYGSVSEDDERLIENYLLETRDMDRVAFFSIDVKQNRILAQEIVIDQQNELLKEYVLRIEELEAEDD